MREIKFRAWTDQGRLGTFRMEHDVGILPLGCSSEWVENLNGLLLKPGNHHVVMQFTGLLDKSGKEIYEGDIIVAGADVTRSGSMKMDIRFVEFKDGGFKARKGEFWYPLEGFGKYEIIGNIYENPDIK